MKESKLLELLEKKKKEVVEQIKRKEAEIDAYVEKGGLFSKSIINKVKQREFLMGKLWGLMYAVEIVEKLGLSMEQLKKKGCETCVNLKDRKYLNDCYECDYSDDKKNWVFNEEWLVD
jgi:hypothetical protein